MRLNYCNVKGLHRKFLWRMVRPMNGKQLRKLRKALGLSQTALGALIGVKGPAVCLWEAGRRKPRGAALMALKRIAKESVAA
jgi:DNA-binding transcriptional regulator YiaG